MCIVYEPVVFSQRIDALSWKAGILIVLGRDVKVRIYEFRRKH